MTEMGAWTIGYNVSGYLPESDILAFESREDAVVAFVAMAKQYADEDDDLSDDEWGNMRATVDSILADDGPTAPGLDSGDYTMTVADGSDRLIAFWIQWSDDLDPDDTD